MGFADDVKKLWLNGINQRTICISSVPALLLRMVMPQFFHRFISKTAPPVLILFTAIVFLSRASYGQAKSGKRNTIYAESFSRGPVYSLNYDYLFRKGEAVSWSLRAGVSVEKNAFYLPLGLNMMTAPGHHHGEFSPTLIPAVDFIDHVPGTNQDGSDKYLYIKPGIGYRFQKEEGGFFLKTAMGPSVFLDPPSDDFWKMDGKVFFFASLGVGISF